MDIARAKGYNSIVERLQRALKESIYPKEPVLASVAVIKPRGSKEESDQESFKEIKKSPSALESDEVKPAESSRSMDQEESIIISKFGSTDSTYAVKPSKPKPKKAQEQEVDTLDDIKSLQLEFTEKKKSWFGASQG